MNYLRVIVPILLKIYMFLEVLYNSIYIFTVKLKLWDFKAIDGIYCCKRYIDGKIYEYKTITPLFSVQSPNFEKILYVGIVNENGNKDITNEIKRWVIYWEKDDEYYFKKFLQHNKINSNDTFYIYYEDVSEVEICVKDIKSFKELRLV